MAAAGWIEPTSAVQWQLGWDNFAESGGTESEFGMWMKGMREGNDGTLPPEAFQDPPPPLPYRNRGIGGRAADASSAQYALWEMMDEDSARRAAVAGTDPKQVKAAWAELTQRQQKAGVLRDGAMAAERAEMQARHAKENRKMTARFAKEEHAAKLQRKHEVAELGRTFPDPNVDLDLDSSGASSAPPTPSPDKLPRNNGAGAPRGEPIGAIHFQLLPKNGAGAAK